MASPPNRPEADPAPLERPDPRVAWAEEYRPALRRYFEKRTSAAEADDLVQDVFLAMQMHGAAGEIENVRGYLFRVAANVLSRRHLAYPQPPGRAVLPRDLAAAADEITPERVVMGREALERVIVALEGLPPRACEAFLLHRFEEKTYEAVARRMGVSAKRVEKLIGQALKRVYAVAAVRP